MAMPHEATESLTPGQLLSALVHNGLGLYASQIPNTDSPALQALKQRPVVNALEANAKLDWPKLCESAIGNILNGNSAMAQMIGDLKMSSTDLFMVGLVGGVDQSTTLAIAIRELQQPIQSHYPSVQLCVDICRTLFNENSLSIPKLLNSRLFTSKVLQLEGQLSLAEKFVRIDPFLWSTLSGAVSFGPRCQQLHPEGKNFLAEDALAALPGVINLLTSNPRQTIHIEGLPGSSRHDLAAAISQGIGKKAMLIPYDIWQKQPALAFNCKFADFVPVIRIPSDHHEATPLNISEYLHNPVIAISTSDTAVQIPNAIKIVVNCDSAEQRHELCKTLVDNRIVAKKLSQYSILSNKLLRMITSEGNLKAVGRGEQIQGQDIFSARCHLAHPYLKQFATYEPPLPELSAYIVPSNQIHSARFCEELIARRGSYTRGLGALTDTSNDTSLKIALLGASGSGKKTFAKYLSYSFLTPLYVVQKKTITNINSLNILLEQAAVHDVILYFEHCPAEIFTQFSHQTQDQWQALNERLQNYSGVCLFSGNNQLWHSQTPLKVSQFDMILQFGLPDVDTREQLWEYHLGSRAPKKAYCRWLSENFTVYPGTIRNACKIAGGATDKKRISEEDLLNALKLEMERFPNTLSQDISMQDSFLEAQQTLASSSAANQLIQNDPSRH